MTRPAAALPLIVLITACAAGGPPEPVAIPDPVWRGIQREPDERLNEWIRDLYTFSADGIVTADDVARYGLVLHARRRAKLLGKLLEFDLDADGRVTRTEVQDAKFNDPGQEWGTIDRAMLDGDADKNGVLTFREMSAFAAAEAGQSRSVSSQSNPMMFDLDRDGKVDPREVSDAIAQIAAAKSTSVPDASAPALGRACSLPALGPDTQTIALSVYDGNALSTVALDGQDTETSVVRVRIEPGDTPLYVFVTGLKSIVWKFEGETGRIERVIAQAGRGGSSGVVGLGNIREKVSFLPADVCGEYATSTDDSKALLLKTKLSMALGRDLSQLIAYSSPGGVGVPSGKELKPGAGSRSDGPTIQTVEGTFVIRDGVPVKIAGAEGLSTEREFLRYYPGGLVEIDPLEVITPGQAARYDVLPQEAGLLQLIADGALRRSPDGVYVIEKPFARFPAGLNGGHSVRFLLRNGIPFPGGSPGHSDVISEETGECIGARCN